jgi:hypothetical protein
LFVVPTGRLVIPPHVSGQPCLGFNRGQGDGAAERFSAQLRKYSINKVYDLLFCENTNIRRFVLRIAVGV